MTTITIFNDITHQQHVSNVSIFRKILDMRNLIKQKHIGITLTIVGIALLSLNFLSYLMSNLFVSKIVLPAGIVLLIAGIIVIRRTGKKSKNRQPV